MSLENTLAGKVIIVTGAGRGIGREIALLAGAHGASVIVNDPGVSSSGDRPDAGPAHEVAEEIVKAGGKAAANLDSVADPLGAERMVSLAIDTFGRIDGVVNNAGILRDRRSLERFVQCRAGGRTAFQGANLGKLRAFHVGHGLDRQFWTVQLRGCQGRNRRPIAKHCHRYGEVRCTVKLRLAFCVY